MKKVAIVTGCGGGIGNATATYFAENGWLVYGLDINHTLFSNPNIHFVQTDISDTENVQKTLNLISKEHNGIDALINNAAIQVCKPILETTMSDWDQVMDINLTSMMFVTRAAAPYLAKNDNSSIVNLASLAGRKGGHAGSLAYSTSKGAILTLTRALSAELGPQGIRVNAVAPGLILGTKFHNTHTTKASAAKTVAGIPIERAGNAADVARAVLYLASEYDGFITGATLDINGGVYNM